MDEQQAAERYLNTFAYLRRQSHGQPIGCGGLSCLADLCPVCILEIGLKNSFFNFIEIKQVDELSLKAAVGFETQFLKMG